MKSLSLFCVGLILCLGCGGKKGDNAESQPNAETPKVAKKEPPKQPSKKEDKFVPRPLIQPRPLRDDPTARDTLDELGAELSVNRFDLIHSVRIITGDADKAIAAISKLEQLRELSLSGLKITDAQLKKLSKAPCAAGLESLEISGAKLTSAAAEHLARFGKLKTLDVSNTRVNDKVLPAIADLAQLERVNLSWTKITGTGLNELTKSKTLVEVDLSFTEVDAKALEQLKQIKTLRSVGVEGSEVLSEKPDKLASTFSGLRLRGLPVKEQPIEDPKKKDDAAQKDGPPPAAPAANFAVGDLAPEISGQDVAGEAFKLSDYRGKVVLLDFWGHWCVHCRNLYPHARKLTEQYKDQPFAILGVNSDGDRELLQEVMKTEKITWRSWFDGGPDGPIAAQWKVRGWPTLYLIDHKGVIRHAGLRGAALDKAIEELLVEAGKPEEAGKKPTVPDDSLKP